jgi:glutamate-1-semialdehyde 2,1-aminomutase
MFERAKRVMPGGVNSSVRVNKALGFPVYVSKARGSKVWDEGGTELIDMSCGHGSALLGHGHPAIDAALDTAKQVGYANAFETEYHIELARRVTEAIPCADMVRFCSSGSEATLHLLRACRAYTGRTKILRFEGHFHGYHELIYIGGHPPQDAWTRNKVHPYVESPGIPEAFAQEIIPVTYNDTEELRKTVERYGHEIAAAILEPVNYNCGCIQPQPGYLQALRSLTAEAGIVLFFDEIQSAFKTPALSAQKEFEVTPDVATIGKALGGGLPLSAFCGKREIMEQYKPVGTVQHSGTFNAHLVPVLTGLAFFEEMAKPTFFPHLEKLEEQFHSGMDEIIRRRSANMIAPHFGARFNIVLGRTTPPRNYQETFCHEPARMLELIRRCYERGVYFHDYGGTPAHHGYSVQHTEADIGRVLEAVDAALSRPLE